MTGTGTGGSPLTCTFCGRTHKQARKLIAGPGRVCICDGCVGLCTALMARERTAPGPGGPHGRPTPREIHDVLGQYVIGQESAKKALSVAVYQHHKRIQQASAGEENPAGQVELGKSNVLLVGPTGCGKTHLVRSLARVLDVPFASADATALTEAGYVGEDVESVLAKLLRAADFDTERAATGIVYIDEIDKIARCGGDRSTTRDVSGEGVQQALLRLLEGTVATVPPQGARRHPPRECPRIDTGGVLFILGGAFTGLERIAAERTARRGIGFGAGADGPGSGTAPGDARPDVLPEDLLRYGLIPELVGRLPVVRAVRPLDRGALMRILTEPRDALLKQYRRLLQLDGVELEFTAGAIAAVAEQALLRRTGARAARTVLEEVLGPVMYELPGRSDVARVIVGRDTVLGHAGPALVPRTRPAPDPGRHGLAAPVAEGA